MTRTLLIVVSDLMFQSRIEAGARAAGLEPRMVDGVEAMRVALADAPAAAVIDLHERSLDGPAAVAEASATVPVLAFGRHTEPATLRAARDAGAAIVVPRSQLVEELPELLRRLTASPP